MFYIYVSFVFELIFSFFIKNFTVLLYFSTIYIFFKLFYSKKFFIILGKHLKGSKLNISLSKNL